MMRGEVEMGASRGMMVLLVKQVHLQKDVGAVGGTVRQYKLVGGQGIWGEDVQAANVRGRRAERERMRVAGSMAREC